MDKPKISKTIQTINFVLVLIFSCCLSFCYIFLNTNLNLNAGNYTNALNKINDFQSNYTASINKEQFLDTEKNAIYTDGLTALLTAYEEYSNMKDVEVEIYGTLIANADVTKYVIEIQGSVKKTNGVVESQINCYCASSNSQNSGSKAIFKDGIIEEIKTDKSTKINGKIIPDYSTYTKKVYNAEDYKSARGTYPGELFYVVNKRSVTNTSNFCVKKNLQGEISGYSTNFKLSPIISTTKYSKMLAGVIGGSKNFIFSQCSGSLNLDENGKLLSMHTNENYTFDYNLFGGAYWNVSCASEMNFIVHC